MFTAQGFALSAEVFAASVDRERPLIVLARMPAVTLRLRWPDRSRGPADVHGCLRFSALSVGSFTGIGYGPRLLSDDGPGLAILAAPYLISAHSSRQPVERFPRLTLRSSLSDAALNMVLWRVGWASFV